MIESCGFGKMTIAGRIYTSDLMILPGGEILDSWRRIEGHRLALNDIQRLLAVQPRIVVAGTGIYGRMRTDPEMEDHLSREGIELIAQRTKRAAKTFNQLITGDQPVAGCFHLTC